MKQEVVDHNAEYEQLVGGVAQTVKEVSDPMAIGAMLYQIAQERKNTNLIIQQLNLKIDRLMDKIDGLEAKKPANPAAIQLSDRDQEVLDYVRSKGHATADDLVKKFKYKGKNAGAARLSKLFHEGVLEKEYKGRKVVYVPK